MKNTTFGITTHKIAANNVEFCYAKCRIFIVVLIVVQLSVIMLNVIILNVVASFLTPVLNV
jgi:hypothetical protein